MPVGTHCWDGGTCTPIWQLISHLTSFSRTLLLFFLIYTLARLRGQEAPASNALR